MFAANVSTNRLENSGNAMKRCLSGLVFFPWKHLLNHSTECALSKSVPFLPPVPWTTTTTLICPKGPPLWIQLPDKDQSFSHGAKLIRDSTSFAPTKFGCKHTCHTHLLLCSVGLHDHRHCNSLRAVDVFKSLENSHVFSYPPHLALSVLRQQHNLLSAAIRGNQIPCLGATFHHVHVNCKTRAEMQFLSLLTSECRRHKFLCSMAHISPTHKTNSVKNSHCVQAQV